ncbi:ubiquitin-conjugating enzyme/RWD-like protein [Hyaloraphidium curvatum]|nr:ubiquitin-conjugating enzyme/RWD-like protein [Hyaloraphidium curvatum]
MDHAEEQAQEIEALESIYYDSFERVSDAPPAFRIRIAPEGFDDAVRALEARRAKDPEEAGDGPAHYWLRIEFPERYPEEPPAMEIEDADGIDEDEATELLAALRAAADENLGAPLVFFVTEAAKEGLEGLITSRKEAAEQERVERLAREEEEEKRRKEGTKVTSESFAAWKKAFEKEMAAQGRSDLVWLPAAQVKVAAKLTGKQLFEQNRGLAVSDSQFMEAGDVAVDMELFDEEELGELDLSDDEEENEVLENLTED